MAGFLVEADWWLYLVLFVSIVILLAINLYIVVIWQHPDDKNEAYFPKAIVLASLTLAELAVILLPLDAANNSGNVGCDEAWSSVFCGTLDMDTAWYIVFMLIFIMALVIVPYTIFFYEEDDSLALTGQYNFRKPFLAATKYMAFVLVIVIILSVVLFLTLGQSDVPVQQYEFDMPVLLSQGDKGNRIKISDPNGLTLDLTGVRSNMSTGIVVSDETVEIQMSFPVFVMGLMAFVGWFLFVIFGGLGLGGIPIDCVRNFLYRPKKLDRGQVAALEMGIQRRCDDLLSVGDQMKGSREETRHVLEGGALGFFERRKRASKEATEFNQFKQAVYILEEDFDNLVICKDYNRKYNPLTPLIWLSAGTVTFIIAVIWIIHIVVYMLVSPSVTPFLNDYFLWFDEWFPLFGVISVALFALYLLAACIKGCFKFGVRVVWFTLHPMKPNGTYMNSFLFNCGVILMCTPPVIQFTVQALSGYLRDTQVTNFFNVQVRYMRFFRYFFENDVFVIALLILSVLCAAMLVFKPVDDPVSAKSLQETLRKSAEEQAMLANPPNPESASNGAEGVATTANTS